MSTEQLVTFVLGPVVNVLETFVNPYDGETIDVNGAFNINDGVTPAGCPQFRDILLGGPTDQIIRLEDDAGNLLIDSYEIILSSSGNDIILFASTTHVLGDIEFQAGSGNDIVWANAGSDLLVGGQGEDILHGGPGQDRLVGGTEADTLFGGTDSDTLVGGTGDDVLFGGSGDDFYQYETGDGTDTILETSGFDVILMRSNLGLGDINFSQIGADLHIVNLNLPGGFIITNFFSGNASFVVEELVFDDGTSFDLTSLLPDDLTFTGTPTLEDFVGGNGSDTVDYSNSETRVKVDLVAGTGTDGDAQGDTYDSIENIIGADLSSSGDFIYGNDSSNHIEGLGGHDVLEGGANADIIDGGAGFDYARYTRSDEAVDIDLTRATQLGGDAGGDQLISIENVTGSNFDDTLTGDDGNNTLRGGNGNDMLSGGLGNDKLFGDRGDDAFFYVGGIDQINERDDGVDSVTFDSIWNPEDVIISGNQLTFRNSIANEITFNDITLIESFVFSGGREFDLAGLQAFSTPIDEGTGAGTEDNFVATAIAENFDGGDSDDTVDYSNSTTRVKVDLETGTGTDGFAAGDTYDSIENIIGADLSTSGDFIYGDDGANHIQGLGGRDVLEGGDGADIIDGGDKEDYARYTRSDNGVDVDLTRATQIGGDAQDDQLISIENLTGSAHNDTLTGDAGRNTLRGERGNDTLNGGDGNDMLYGGRNDDLLIGGGGTDNLYGQDGADTFGFDLGSVDVVRDFDLAEGDKLDISDLLIGYDTVSDTISNFVQLTDDGTNSFLAVDADGGADNFVQVARINGFTTLNNEDFLEATGTLVTV